MVKGKINIINETPAVKNYTIKHTILKAKYQGKPMKESFFTAKTPKTRQQIVNLVKIAQNAAKKNNQDVDFIVGLRYNGGDRSGKLFSLDAEPELFDPDNFYSGEMSKRVNKKGQAIHVKQQTTFKSFYIISVPRASKKGGADIKNDCLFNAIVKGLNGANNLDVQWNTAEKFKNRLGLERNELVSVDLFPLIEEGLKVNLNCYGSKSYISERKYKRCVNINISLSHFTLDKAHTNKKFTVTLNSKPIAYFELVNDMYHIITEENEWNELAEIKYLSQKYKNFFFIDMTKKVNDDKTLRELYDEFVSAREILNVETIKCNN